MCVKKKQIQTNKMSARFSRRARIAFGDQLQSAAAESGRRRGRDGQTVAGTSPPPGQCCLRHGKTATVVSLSPAGLYIGRLGAFSRTGGTCWRLTAGWRLHMLRCTLRRTENFRQPPPQTTIMTLFLKYNPWFYYNNLSS